MIEHLLNQKAIWYKCTGLNDYAKPKYADPVQIEVNWQDIRRQIQTGSSESIYSDATVFCIEPVNVKDKIFFEDREWIVLHTEKTPNIAGEFLFREVYL